MITFLLCSKPHREAQQELNQLLENLSVKLKSIQKSQETPVVFDDYVRKLINVKHKVTVIYNILNSSQVLIIIYNKNEPICKHVFGFAGSSESGFSASREWESAQKCVGRQWTSKNFATTAATTRESVSFTAIVICSIEDAVFNLFYVLAFLFCIS